ncbi:MAG: DUF6115 domain-containing protein [Clostridiaceae bacterium]|nr:DUF6115 domain-containing protein [Clostridiaceae bacterium]
MIFLECIMIVIGLGAVWYSFRRGEKNNPVEDEREQQPGQISAEADFSEQMRQTEEKMDALSQEKVNDLEARFSELSNEKIMGISEYSDQVMDQIEKNHAEVLFLYDMMNEKQEEMKKLVTEMDSVKADMHNEAAKEYQKLKEQETQLEELLRSVETEMLQYQKEREMQLAKEDAREEEDVEVLRGLLEESDEPEEPDFSVLLSDDAKLAMEDSGLAAEHSGFSPYDDEIARIEEQEAKEQLENEDEIEIQEMLTQRPRKKELAEHAASSQQHDIVNHNNEIISLYKKGRSVLDISKMLSLGQGEVKFVIDLYNAR